MAISHSTDNPAAPAPMSVQQTKAPAKGATKKAIAEMLGKPRGYAVNIAAQGEDPAAVLAAARAVPDRAASNAASP